MDIDSANPLVKESIYDRWVKKNGRAKIMEAQRIKCEKIERRRPKWPEEQPRERKDVFLGGLQKAKYKLTKSLNKTLKSFKQKRAADPKKSKEKVVGSMTRTLQTALRKQPLFQKKQARAKEIWMAPSAKEILLVGITEEKGQQEKISKAYQVLQKKLANKAESLTPKESSEAESILSNSLGWAKSGTWPSHFSTNSFRSKKSQAEPFAESGTKIVPKQKTIYERWLESKSDAVGEAQRRIKEAKRCNRLTSGNLSNLNSRRLKDLFERNHLDDRQDAIQGKKFTYAWILEQEGLVPLRLENLDRGLPEDQIEVEPWKFADCINAFHPWEANVELDFEENS